MTPHPRDLAKARHTVKLSVRQKRKQSKRLDAKQSIVSASVSTQKAKSHKLAVGEKQAEVDR